MPLKSIAAAYRDEAPGLRPFYAAWPRALFDTSPARGECWPGLANELDAYNASIGNAPAPLGECFVVTGQQPALFTGPLYTVYKIATAVRLAAAIAQRHGVRCTPVFWQGNDDHDFEEARSATVLTKGHAPLTLTYRPDGDVSGLPMFRVPLGVSAHELVDRAADETPGSDMREEVRAFLHDSAAASRSLAEWSARIVARLFAGSGLVIFNSESRAARLAAQDVFAREVRAPLLSTQLVNNAGARLAALGYEQQVSKGGTECGFFIEFDGRRCKVVYEDGAFRVPAMEMRYTRDELLGVLAEQPERFSPNVALRCIVQQRLFPVAAYVAGPGEIAYWGQFKPLFDEFALPMPVVYPRARCVLTTPKLNTLRAKLGLGAGDAVDWQTPDSVLARALRAGSGNDPMVAALHARRAAVDGELRALEGELAKAPAPVASLVDRVTDAFENYERMLVRADTARFDTVRQQVTRLCSAFAPFRKPQERVYTIVSYLFEHGWDLVPRMVREIDIESFGMNEIEL